MSTQTPTLTTRVTALESSIAEILAILKAPVTTPAAVTPAPDKTTPVTLTPETPAPTQGISRSKARKILDRAFGSASRATRRNADERVAYHLEFEGAHFLAVRTLPVAGQSAGITRPIAPVAGVTLVSMDKHIKQTTLWFVESGATPENLAKVLAAVVK